MASQQGKLFFDPMDSKVYPPNALVKHQMKDALQSYYEADYACNMHYLQISRKFFKPTDEEVKSGEQACVMAKMAFIGKLFELIEKN